MSADISPYLGLVASEHQDQPNYNAFISVFLQGMADAAAIAASLTETFDLDTAVGVQLDRVGQWIGQTRILRIPITGAFFSWDIDTIGWDQGIWFVPGDESDSIVALPDEQFRALLKATALANRWDGSVSMAEECWGILFAGTPFQVLIIDNMDMSMDLYLFGGVVDPVTQALFEGGYLNLKPVGVRVNYHTIGGPVFGLDMENDAIKGFDEGDWF